MLEKLVFPTAKYSSTAERIAVLGFWKSLVKVIYVIYAVALRFLQLGP